MSRKIYYYILSISFILIASSFLFNAFFFNDPGVRIATYGCKSLLILTIFIVETINATKVIRILNIIWLSFLLIGIMFRIMHWPFGALLYLLPVILIIVGLTISNLKKSFDRPTAYLILIVPLLHFIEIFINQLYTHRSFDIFWLVSQAIALTVGIVLTVKVFKMP